MKTQEQIDKFSEAKFQRTFGVKRQIFGIMLEILQKQYIIEHAKGGRPPKITVFDRLCILLAYYRDYRTMEDIANEYNLEDTTLPFKRVL